MKNFQEIFNEFVNKVMTNESSFEIVNADSSDYMSFMKRKVGNCEYIYGIRSYSESGISAISKKPELVAITADGRIYIVAIYELGIYNVQKIAFPENVEYLSADNENKYLMDVILPNYIDTLVVEEDEKSEYTCNCLETARMILLDNYKLENYNPHFYFTQQDKADMLCGFLDFDEAVKKGLEENKDYLLLQKRTRQRIDELVESPDTVEPWELKLADSIKTLDAKAVLTEFELNGKKASAKINPKIILNTLIAKTYFSGYNFISQKEGKTLLRDLGTTTYWSDENRLTCQNISKITFRNKEVYVREN